MFSRIKSISFVGTLILALISPATPASIAAVTNLQTEVIFNGSAINGTVEILDGSLNPVEQQAGVSQTFASLANGDYVVVASQNQDSPTNYLMSDSMFDLSVDDTGVTAFHARGDSLSPVAESAAGVYQLEIAVANYYLPVRMPDGSALSIPDAAVQDDYGFDGALEVANGSSWDFVMPWMSYFEMGESGLVSGGVAGMIGEPGTYRVVVDPAGFSDIRVTSTEFTVAEGHDFSTQVALSPLNLKSANFQVSPMSVDGSSVLDSSAVRVFKADGPTSAPLKGEFVTDSGTSDGSTLSFSLVDGSYVIDVVPQGGGFGLAEKTYYLEMSSSVPTVTGTDAARTSYSANPAEAANPGVFELPVASANILGTLVDDSNNPIVPDYQNSKWINVNLLQSFDGGNYFGWVSSTDVDNNGQFAFGVAAGGEYKLEIEFNGFPDFGGISQLVTFTDANIDTPQTFTLTPAAPDLKIAVRVPDGNSNLTNADIEIFNGYEYVGRGSTSESGIAALTLPDVDSQTVEYELRVNPPRSAFGTAKISYTAEVVDDGSTRTVSVKTRTSSPTTVAPVDGITTLTLGVPTLSGVVTDPNGSLVRNVEVVPIDTATGQEIWESMAVTDAFGRWSMALAQGSYDVFARAPWGDVTFGDGERVGPVAVDASGNATSVPAGVTAGSFDLSLSNPTWSGTLVDPNDSSNVLTMGNICLATGSYEMRNWNCAQTNSEGKWSLSKPSGFTGFLEIDELMISEWGTGAFAERRLEGVTAIENVLGTYVAGTSYENIQLSPKAPNLKITVSAGAAKAARVWVSVESAGAGFNEWLGGGETNSDGVANIGIPDANLNSQLIVQVYVEHVDSLSQDYSNTRATLTGSPDAGGVRTEAVSLSEPNFSVTLSEPSSGPAVSYGWIEIMNQDTGEWVGGANTNQSGTAAMNLPADATYDVTVNPSWNGDSSFTKKTYVVEVNAGGALTSVTDSNSVTVVGAGSPVVYPLVLGTPSLTGLVRDSSGNAQADSWVAPINHTTKEYLWYLGANTRSGGQFSMDLANGQYYLEAQPSWRNSGDTTSAQCSVEIASSSLNQSWAAADRCAIDLNGNALLDLRAPNLSFTLKDASGAVVPYANVGMFLNEWSVWAQSNRYGVVSLFVSGDDINAQTDLGSGTHDIRIVVEPPYGNGDIARIECDSGESQPLCAQIPDYDQDAPSDLDTAIGALALSEVSFAAPNTKLRVADPAGSPLLAEGSWVNIFEEVAGETQWVAGANSDSNGWVSFNLDEDVNKTYMVEVNPAYEKRDDYAQTTYAGLTQAGLVSQQLFNLGTPNFKLKVMKEDGSGVSRWGWVGVEEVDANGDYIDWVTGVGTDRNGYVALSLEANKRYRIILNPGEVSDGSITRCLFEVDALGAVSYAGGCGTPSQGGDGVWSINLSAGNVRGHIYYVDSSTALGGAIIQATSGAGADTETVTTVAATDGSYGLDLDLSATWTITAVYAKDPEDSNVYVQDSSTLTVNSDTSTANLTFTAPTP